MHGAQDEFHYRQQCGELVAGPRRVPGLPDPVGEIGAGGQGILVLGAQDEFNYRQQRGELVASPRRVPGPPGPGGEVGAGVERTGVLGA